MKSVNRTCLGIILGGLLLLGLAALHLPTVLAEGEAAARTKWEYKVIQPLAHLGAAREIVNVPGTLETACAKLGEEGWELCGVLRFQQSEKALDAEALVFKRTKK